MKAAELGNQIPPERRTVITGETGFDFSFSSPPEAKKSKKKKKKTLEFDIENDERKKPSSNGKNHFMPSR